MLTINGIEITERDFKELLLRIRITRKWLAEGNIRRADYILGVLETNLETNLRGGAR